MRASAVLKVFKEAKNRGFAIEQITLNLYVDERQMGHNPKWYMFRACKELAENFPPPFWTTSRLSWADILEKNIRFCPECLGRLNHVGAWTSVHPSAQFLEAAFLLEEHLDKFESSSRDNTLTGQEVKNFFNAFLSPALHSEAPKGVFGRWSKDLFRGSRAAVLLPYSKEVLLETARCYSEAFSREETFALLGFRRNMEKADLKKSLQGITSFEQLRRIDLRLGVLGCDQPLAPDSRGLLLLLSKVNTTLNPKRAKVIEVPGLVGYALERLECLEVEFLDGKPPLSVLETVSTLYSPGERTEYPRLREAHRAATQLEQ